MIHPFISGISSIPPLLPTLQSSLKSYDPAAGSQIPPYRTPLPYSTSIRECMFRSIMNCSHVDCSCMDCSCLNFFYIPILRLKIFIVRIFLTQFPMSYAAKNLFCIQSTEPLYTKEVSVGVHISIQKSPPHLIPEDTLKIFICAVVQKQEHLSRRDNDHRHPA